MAEVTRQPRQLRRVGSLQAVHPDPGPQPAANLAIRDRRIRGDRQHLVEQTDPSLGPTRPFGELLVEAVPGMAFPARQRLVEQADHLVQDIHRRLSQQRQQDRIAPLDCPANQRLRGRTATDPGQEPAPLRRDRRQVHRVGV